jgi:hypothetical protein
VEYRVLLLLQQLLLILLLLWCMCVWLHWPHPVMT